MRQQTITWHTFNDLEPDEETDILWFNNIEVMRVGKMTGRRKFEDNESGLVYEIDPMDEWAYINQ